MVGSLESKIPYVIAIANEKGGVGKTTTTLAIGSILAQRGFKVLFIDLDPQGNLTLAVGYKPHQMPPPSGDIPTMGTLFAYDTFRTEVENLDLVFARSLIVNDDYQIQINTGDDDYFLSEDLRVIKTLPYDYVVIDCPPSIGKIAINTLLVSDFLIIPSQAEFFSTFALKNMMEVIGEVRKTGNPYLLYRIVITLFEKRNRVHRNMRTQLNYTFGAGLFDTIIEVDTEMRKTAIQGFPTISSRGVKQYRLLVDELLAYIQTTKSSQAHYG
jgi:chromosome partitioning protein